MLSKKEQKQKAYEFVDFLIDNDYWGEVTWKFEKGNVVHLKLSRGLKLESMDFTSASVYKAFINKKRERKGFKIQDSARIEETVETK